MKKICIVSGIEFEITKEDQEFYKKLGVPEPRLCPEERQRRRFLFRNERKMYHRNCDATGKKIISYYSADKNLIVYEKDYWWSDEWEALDYGIGFNFGKTFFEQFKNLYIRIPKISMMLTHCENCDWSPYGIDCKNCYLSISCCSSEDTHFSFQVNKSDNCLDSIGSNSCQLCYEIINCRNCYKLLYSNFCFDCSNSYLLNSCIDCEFCIGCVNLRNKKYCIFNKQYEKEEYFEKLKELNLQDYKNFNLIKIEFERFSKSFPVQYMFGEGNENSYGDNINNCKDCYSCFDISGAEDSKFCKFSPYGLKNSYDINYSPDSEFLYESISSCNSYNSIGLSHSWNLKNSYYCSECFYSENLFGCVGLKNKKYCIFNKQYTKDKYFELKEKIIEHMRGTLEWGEFFPTNLSPFGYNETVSQEYYSLSKKQAIEKGYSWKNEEQGVKYTGPQTKIPDNIENINKNILKEILECESCNKNYRIVGPEFTFYKKMSLPIPRKCPNCRYNDRLKLRNPRKLFDRKCDKCLIDLQSTYSPDREEKVYCEECYNKEVY